MGDLLAKLERARAHVRPKWSEERTRVLVHGLARKQTRQRQRRIAVAFALGALIVSVLFGVGWRERTRWGAAKEVVASPSGNPGASPEDEFTATPLDSTSILEAAERTPERVVFRVPRGGGKFTVVHRPTRIFRVEVGSVVVEDIGTSFTVEHVDGNAVMPNPLPAGSTGVRVSVDHGRVRVSWLGLQTELADGESRVFPDVLAASAPREIPEPEGSSQAPPPRPTRAANDEPSWQALANDGKFDRAYEAWQRQGPAPAKDDIAELLLIADVARLSHHPAEAVSPLRRAIDGHRSDQRAPLAAFTLGRVLLEELGRPLEAAQAFSEARALAPGGALASDALAREIEARSRAGDNERTKTLAEEYVRRYPSGSRLRSVKRFGNLE